LTRVVIVNQFYFLKWLLVFVYQYQCRMWCRYIYLWLLSTS
jgi:hypothetical protein